MYTGKHAHLRPLQPAFIMAACGEAVTYAELEVRCNHIPQCRPDVCRCTVSRLAVRRLPISN
jgi:hypothetical protein